MFTFKKFAVVSVAALTAVLSISCSDQEDPEPGEYKDLVRKNITLSLSGKSYGDLDAGQTYGQSDLSSKAGDIDVVAYYSAGADDNVKNPCIVTTIGPDDCGYPELYTIPPKYHAQLANGATTEDIKDFLEAFSKDEFDDNEEDEISISKGSAFLVFTTKEKYFAVVISNTGTQSVSLDFTGTGLQQ